MLISSIYLFQVSNTTLDHLSERLGDLVNLQNLVMRGNKLTSLPSNFGNLKRLKNLDLSNNELTEVPDSLGDLGELYSLILKGNQLTRLPNNLDGLVCLHSVDISQMKLQAFPASLCTKKLVLIDTLVAHHNEIHSLPREVANLTNLKLLDLENNEIGQVPSELAKCTRLKELKLRANPIADRRLFKLVHDERMQTKQILDYLSTTLSKSKKGPTKGKATGPGRDQEDLDAQAAEEGAPAAGEVPTTGEGSRADGQDAQEGADACGEGAGISGQERAETGSTEELAAAGTAAEAHKARRKKKREVLQPPNPVCWSPILAPQILDSRVDSAIAKNTRLRPKTPSTSTHM